MTDDLGDIESRINDGIYGDDRMTDTDRDDAFAALAALLAEVERLRGDVERLQQVQPKRDYYASLGAAQERAAVVAYLRAAYSPNTIVPLPEFLAAPLRMAEKGEHHQEGNE